MGSREVLAPQNVDAVKVLQNVDTLQDFSAILGKDIKTLYIPSGWNTYIPQGPLIYSAPLGLDSIVYLLARMANFSAQKLNNSDIGFIRTAGVSPVQPDTALGFKESVDLLSEQMVFSWQPTTIFMPDFSDLILKVTFFVQLTSSSQNIQIDILEHPFWFEFPVGPVPGITYNTMPKVFQTNYKTINIQSARDTNRAPVPTVVAITVDLTSFVRYYKRIFSLRILAPTYGTDTSVCSVYTRFSTTNVNGSSVNPSIEMNSVDLSRAAYGNERLWAYTRSDDGTVSVTGLEDIDSKYVSIPGRDTSRTTRLFNTTAKRIFRATEDSIVEEENPTTVNGFPTSATIIGSAQGKRKTYIVRLSSVLRRSKKHILRFFVHKEGEKSSILDIRYATPQASFHAGNTAWDDYMSLIRPFESRLAKVTITEDGFVSVDITAVRADGRLDEIVFALYLEEGNPLTICGIKDLETYYQGQLCQPVEIIESE